MDTLKDIRYELLEQASLIMNIMKSIPYNNLALRTYLWNAHNSIIVAIQELEYAIADTGG